MLSILAGGLLGRCDDEDSSRVVLASPVKNVSV
jgi:hypothetical protein